jgi:hypothetical protein
MPIHIPNDKNWYGIVLGDDPKEMKCITDVHNNKKSIYLTTDKTMVKECKSLFI